MVDSTQLDKVIAGIQKKYPESIGIDRDRNPHRISTGSLELDRATGGGVPLGRFTRIWGAYSTGKTLTAWNVARAAQAMGLTVAYYNIENVYDEDYVKELGVDTDPNKLVIIDGEIIEQVGVKLQALLDVVHVHIIDSLSSAMSLVQTNTPLENEQRLGLNAVAWQRVLQLAQSKVTRDNAVIMIDQARDTMGYGGGEHPPGGRYIEFTSSLTIYFRKGKWLFYDGEGFLSDDATNTATLSGMTEADGIEIQAKITKTKVCKPHRTAKMYLDFQTKEYDRTFELEKAARFFKIVEGAGAWFTLPNGNKVQGRKSLRKAIEEDADLQNQIIERLKLDW